MTEQMIITQEQIEDIVSIAMKKGNANGIRGSIYFIENMKKVKPDVTVEELIEGLTQLVNEVEGSKSNAKQ